MLKLILLAQNKKRILIIFFILLFILGCTTSTTKTTTKDIDVRVGFAGLTLEFLKNTPPQKVFEGDVFPTVIKVGNKGAFSLKDNDKSILSLGIEKDYTKKVELLTGGKIEKVKENAASFNLEGRSTINQKGEEEVISYNIQAGKVDPQSEAHPSTVIATLCYPYETVLSSTVCVDTDISGIRPGKKVCKLQDMVFSNGQGAPVAVTKVEMQMLPSQESQQSPQGYGNVVPQFLIYVENKGQGTVIRREVVDKFCTQSSTTHEDLNIVYVDAYLSGTQLECQLQKKLGSNERGHIKLKDKKDIIWCALKEKGGVSANQDSYLTPLKIVLSYGYTQSISANYLIQKIAR
ncbi:hypothetical protein HYX03_04595 [Candidatus Woesearchaeota archaeon]|nr:hypothetical protein [Candidatus Woesearchaeota archaeon]